MDGEQSMAAPSHGQVDGAQKVRALQNNFNQNNLSKGMVERLHNSH